MEKMRYYVCSPLSAPTKNEVVRNMLAAQNYSSMLEHAFGIRGMAPHGYLPMLLNDYIEDERALALKFGLELLDICDGICLFGNRISNGMWGEVLHAANAKKPIFVWDSVEILEELASNSIPARIMQVESEVSA